MAKPYGMLVEGFNYSGVSEDAFNHWYDKEVIPARKRIKGFLNIQRWVSAEELSSMPGLGAAAPKLSIVTYELSGLNVLASKAYRKTLAPLATPQRREMLEKCPVMCHFEAEQTLPGRQQGSNKAGGMMMFVMNVSPNVDTEFNAWFDDEHIPALAKVPGVLNARRFRMPLGTHRYLVLYHLTDPAVQATQAWKDGGASPWTERMKTFFLAPECKPIRYVLRRYGKPAA